jgi:hypothetical protein
VKVPFGKKSITPPPDSSRNVTIPLSGSAYTHPGGDTKVYFLAKHTGRLEVRLKARSSRPAIILVKLDQGAKDTTIRLEGSGSYTTIDAGCFELGAAGYHFISLRPAGGDRALPDITDMILSGEAAEGVLCNNSRYRGAPSTHLRYEVPGDSAAAWFYTEVSVPEGVDATNAYYETNGFADGYMGIQVNSPTERRFIFSIWSNYRTDDPKQIPSEYAVKLVKKGKDVFSGEFGNEGSGGHTHLVLPWKNGTTYKMLVGAVPAGDHTIFTAWYLAPGNEGWRLIAQWDKSKTGGKLLSHLYAFVENFGDNGEDYFTARYGNQWICTPSGNWIELTKARFTTTADRVRHPRFDYGTGVTPVNNAGGKTQDWFYMFSGGFRQVNNLPPGSFVSRAAGGVPPAIDLAALPDK